MKETFVAETLIRRNIDRNKEQIRYLERKIEATNVLHLLRDGWRPWCALSYEPSNLVCEFCGKQ